MGLSVNKLNMMDVKDLLKSRNSEYGGQNL